MRWSFSKNSDGNIAVIFAIAMVPMIGFIGAAIDYTHASAARTSMQAALDSTSLMVARDLSSGAITSSQVLTKAQAYFNALYKTDGAASISVNATYTPPDTTGKSSVLVTGSASVPTSFLAVTGHPQVNINSASTSTWGGNRLRVAMVLDVTGSMNDHGKIDAMKSAASDLVNTLKGLGSGPDDIYISVVPFTQMVNVGVANKNASWLDWHELGSCSSSDFNTKDGCNYNGGTWTSTNNRTAWAGCITDRDQPYDTKKDLPTSANTDFPAVFYYKNGANICPAEILPLTSTYTAASTQLILDKINSLVAQGGTNQPIGIEMAWQTLQPGIAPAKDATAKYTDIIIVLSDGLNTIDRWYGNSNNSSPEVDARQKILCDNINAQPATTLQDYRMYTVQVNTDGDPESAPLKNCASANGGFFPTSTASGITVAFSAIATSITALRLSK